MRKLTPLLLFASLLIPASGALAQQAKPVPNADVITAAQLKDYLSFIASDEMEGRGTPSRGLNTASLFIATLLSRWGATPAGDDGTFYQYITLSENQVDRTKTTLTLAGQNLKYGEHFFAALGSGTGSAQVVFGGDGWLIKSKGVDPYKDVDPKGKIVIVRNSDGFNPPAGFTRNDLTGTPGQDWANPFDYAIKRGAVGLIYLVRPENLASWDGLMAGHSSDGQFMERFKSKPDSRLPSFYVKPSVAEAIFSGEQTSSGEIFKAFAANRPVPSFELSLSKKLAFNLEFTSVRSMVRNVVAKFEGSDPVLRNEYVAFGAHYDHLGLAATPVNGDSVYNGADDDGSGTTALIAMAEALSKAKVKPRRSTLFVWHCGEERGLWGSHYFTTYPTIPLKQIVTQLNIDMIGRSKAADDDKPADKELSGPNEIYVIGSGMMSTELRAISERVNENYLKLQFNYRYDDPKDPNRFFFRSDHYNYAARGVPIIFYFDGVHEDYHQLTDEVSKIDFNKMQLVARTVYTTMWDISNRDKRVIIDKKLPY